MKPWMFAMIGVPRQQTSVTFTANGTFTAPVTTSRVDLSGKGGAGAPGSTLPEGYQIINTTYIENEDGTTEQLGPSEGAIVRGEPMPSDYCDPPQPFGTATRTDCYNFAYVPEQDAPATTGASSTAIGKTFPGGTGGAATTVSFTNVPITPGAAYAIKVPSGGSVTITYTF